MFRYLFSIFSCSYLRFHFLGAALGAVGAIAGGLIGRDGQKSANAQSAASVREQMDFQERMSNSSYQRGMADMKKAGLNPMLAFMKGGANVPDGAHYEAKNEGAPLGAGVSSAAQVGAQIENTRAQTAAAQAQAQKSEAEAVLATAQAAETEARTPTHAANIALTQEQTGAIWATVQAHLSKANLDSVAYNLVLKEIDNAVKTGQHIDASTGNTKADTVLKQITSRLHSLEIPMAENKAAMANTPFGRVVPYVGPASSAIGAAAQGIGVGAGLSAARKFFGRNGNPSVFRSNRR